ncbi:Golgi apparatus membrane protein TVP38 [Coprinopsis marcescibilis]|uniref:Golgi apparatus membrane protein TVP38 n=1 Tax=Coprinopsis marcescibilis TaxID=230819 RepID=A0A5C3L7Q5_COPMA|nr:Golgi apparatus membrane protein TVP38 [Coprinopsis marcescibilis]
MAATSVSRPWNLLKWLITSAIQRYHKLHVFGKVFIWLLVLFYVAFGAFVFIVTPSRIAQFLYDQAKLLAATRLGWLGIIAAMILISFPPFIGHTTLVTLCGFAYGMKGFYIAIAGSLLGSALVFTVLRLLFSQRIRAWSAQNEKWQALEAVVRSKGLPLIILIRVSPFPPWVYANSLFASIEPVKLWQFVVATCFISPKLLLHVFIGSKMAALSDGDQRGRMDTHDKIINGLLVGGGIIIAIFTSWLVYNLVQSHIRHLQGIPPETDELAAEAIEDYDEDAPLLSPTHSRV